MTGCLVASVPVAQQGHRQPAEKQGCLVASVPVEQEGHEELAQNE
jgi:hypothetical protein